MMLGWLRSQALRPFYEADAGGSAGSGTGDGSSTLSGTGQADSTSQASAQAAGGSSESAEDRATRLERELTETRKEAAKYRVEKRTQAEAERKAAEESGQFKTLYEQAQAKLAEIEQTQAKAAQDALRAKAAKDAGLSEDLADRLVGSTPAELLADAQALAKRLAPTPPSTGATNPGAKRAPSSEDEQIEAMFSGKGKARRSGMKW